MSSPSSQNIGSEVSLAWSCQVIDGVMTKSPGSIAVRSPSTAVVEPLPSSTKRSADWLCRCAGAMSPGITICTPANSEVVTFDCPRSPGFSSTSTRLVASLAVISFPASVM